MDSGSHTQHLLGLKVMRMTKPSLMSTVPVLGEPWDMLGMMVEDEVASDIRSPRNLPAFSTGEVLALPQSFGMIFLGETFSGFVTVHNDSQEVVKEVLLKVELLTPSQRISLLAPPQINQLNPGGCEERIVGHEVKELGEHSLICSATYTVHSSGEELFLRKFFKFNVAKPLDVKTKFLNVEDDILLEVQIQNTTPNPMFLEVVNFDPASGFTAEDLNRVDSKEEEDSDVSVFGKEGFLVALNTRQYLYKISPLIPVHNIQTSGKTTHVSVGKMDIVWRTKFGEKGRIQTGQLKAVIPPLPELKVSLVEAPGTVQIEQAFKVTCLITNTSNHPMRLRSVLERQPGAGVLWSGNTGKILNELPGGSSMELVLTLVPITPGLHNIGPLTFLDMLSNQKRYHFNKIGQVFVEHLPLSTPSTVWLHGGT